jgi:hypothetical protein
MSDNTSPANVSPENDSLALLKGSKKVKKSSSSGRPKKPIWRFYKQKNEVDKGHYVATCLSCRQAFHPGKTAIMEKHIINCPKVEQPIHEAVMYSRSM